jgi:hypothetical protein
MNVIPYQSQHALLIDVQAGQSDILDSITYGYASALERSEEAYTGVLPDSTIVFCCGKMKIWDNRWVLWALLSEAAGKYMLRVTRIGQRLLSKQSPGRYEATVRHDFEQAHRWCQLLGMKFHHHEECFLPNGEDADVYVRFI